MASYKHGAIQGGLKLGWGGAMLLSRHSVTASSCVEDALEGIRSRSSQFTNLDSKSSKDWSYRFNRVFIGSARLGVSSTSHISYEQICSNDIVVTGVFSGVERMSVGGLARHNARLASFAPLVSSRGEISNATYWTVRLCPVKFATYLDTMEVSVSSDEFLERYWYTALPASGRFNRFVNYLLHHVELFGAPLDMEAKAFEDLLYLNAARLMLIEDEHPFTPANSKNIERCAVYIEENMHREITTIELAGLTGMSVRSLQYLFKKHTGSGIRKFVVEQKLLRARELMAYEGGRPGILSVSLAVGFENPSYFAKIYKSRFGETPSETIDAMKIR